MSDSVRSRAAKIAAHTRWAGEPNRSAATAPGRQAFRDRFLSEARERFGDLPEAELAYRAEHLRKAYYLRLAAASAKARRAKVGARVAR